MKPTKQQILDNLEEVKKYIAEAENKKEEKVIGIAIKNHFTGEIIFQSTKTTYKEAIIEKGDTNLRNADLRGADLLDTNLRNADLRGADLLDTDLRNADLRGADLLDTNLRNADLRDAELNCAKFYGKGGTKELKRSQLKDFLGALGFVIVED